MTYKIIAYKDRFDTIEKAAHAEKEVNWKNSASEECKACTECFSALDLKRVLESKKGIAATVVELESASGTGDTLVFVGEKCVREACDRYGIPFQSIDEAEGCRIYGKKVDNTQIVLIYGGSRAGTLYATATYMEYHGIQFISPGDAGTYYNPELDKSEETEFDITEIPSYETRECYSEFVNDSRYELLLWLVHNKMNYAFLHTINNPELLHKMCLKMSGGGHTIWYEYMDINQEYPYKHGLFGGEGKPEDPYPVSVFYKGDVNQDGILSYGEAHPEWYALQDGKRNLFRDYKAYHETGYATGDYICTSNEEGVKEFCKLVVDSLSEGAMKDLSCIKLFALDNGNWCQCERCRDLPLSYRQLMLAYYLDKAIKKATKEGRIVRKITITIPAYHETLIPPDRPLPEDFDYDTITVIFYVIERCYVHNINDTKCVETNKMLYERLMSWVSGFYKGKLTIGEYYNVSAFAAMPFILTERMANDIAFYYGIGARHMHYMHMTASNWGVSAINNYMYSKLLWNVTWNKEVLKHRYFSARYGEYASKMQSLYEELERICANCKRIKHYQYINDRIRGLATELKNNQKELFDYNHMKFEGRAEDYQAGPSLTETVTEFEKCFKEFCKFIEDKDFSLFQEDYEQLEYGLNMLKFIYYKVLEVMKDDSSVEKELTFYTKQLEQTTRPLGGYDVKNLFNNGLTATRMLEE
ncbi:MAG: DUF4838 domain-containing protein [Lachnospiraceae bacterium]|nr:DUF4838 domain-containing protein [Lachnospiraceae bacterium]